MESLYDNTKKARLTNTTKDKYPKRMFFENYEYIPKQQLISFLENKINLCNRDLKEFNKNASANFNFISTTETIKNTCQEVLDFINNGGKDE